MDLPAPLAWLVDEAIACHEPEQFLATLGRQLLADNLPLAGGALTLAVPDPIIAHRSWLWQAETGAVIERLSFKGAATGGMGPDGAPQDRTAEDWLAGLGSLAEDTDASNAPAPVLRWAGIHPFSPGETERLHQVARFAATPLALLKEKAALSALLDAYLGRRSAARVRAGAVGRGTGETIRAVLLCADLRNFTTLSETTDPDLVIAALDAWFDRMAGAIHAFGGEVLKFIGDGLLAIFPVIHSPAEASDAALRAVIAARAGMAHLDATRKEDGLSPLPFGVALHLGDILWGNIGAADRLDFTAIGPAVNLVSRLEGLCRPLGRSVLASGAVAAQTSIQLVPLGEHRLRGIAAPCAIFAVPDA
ncbi:adenylate/guanylate cyclase domain-containing protein [Ensifer sp.]|jgi:class 3 adenylate cyclase|uniref:adenylate/guanylate cyclase domain-containing protein n=1 Tax=Ensifer sp. TaxID=1872086 RepID=UPI002E10C31C|nr:adenylate/guanylate cyclase domain-containing protein [Ensifer sp.]